MASEGKIFFIFLLAHGELLWSVNVHCPSCFFRRAASAIALKAYSSYTPGPIDLILGRKHRGDL